MEKLLNIDEVAEMLGVTKATIYSWTYRNKIPHIKLSKRLLKFREKDIMDWISEKSSTSAPVSSESRVARHKSRFKPGPSRLDDERIERIVRNAKEEVLKKRKR